VARAVFFSFHYKQDIIAANIVRRAWQFDGRGEAEYLDRSIWEAAHVRAGEALREVLTEALERTTVTAVLIGASTWRSEWVHYEIFESRRRGNGLLGICIHDLGFTPGTIGAILRSRNHPGQNPFAYHRADGTCISAVDSRRRMNLHALVKAMDPTTTIAGVVPIYDWVPSRSPREIGDWVESAFNHRELTRIRTDAKWVPGGWSQ
jgi:hypothetical protein